MINMVGVEYAHEPPPSLTDIPAVVSAVPNKRLRKDKDKERDGSGKKKNPSLDILIDSERGEIGLMGCFFEARA